MSEPIARVSVRELVDRGVIERPMDGNHGEIHPKAEDFLPAGVPFITAADLRDGHVDIQGSSFISVQQAKSLRKGFAKLGDVLLTHKATLGRTAIVDTIPEGVDFLVLTPQVTYYRILQSDVLNPRYLKYYFDSSAFQAILAAWGGSGSTRAYLGITKQLDLPIAVPSIDTQRAIADVLGALDAKIVQNRRTAWALERLARALFRAWFVDFEPVRAKAEGAISFPAMPQHVFDALPTDFVESEIGPVPEGWWPTRLGDCCEINKRSVRKDEVTGEIEYVDITSVSVGRLDAVQRVSFEEAPSRARRRVAHGDTIWSCVRPNRRSYLFMHSPAANLIVSTGFVVLSPSYFGPSYLHQLVTQSEFVDYLVANADGSAYPAVRPEHFASAPALRPPTDVLQAFELATMPARDLIASTERESRNLAGLRDYLLPRMVSGRVRVRLGSDRNRASA